MAKRKPQPLAKTVESKTTITVSTPRLSSFRVEQVAGMFDLTIPPQLSERWELDLAAIGEGAAPWQIGCIVGPSGSGKSTIARHLFGDNLYQGHDWPKGQAVVDAFPPELSIQEITGMLTSVGFSSPPSWVKPYHVLSNGERFRCDLALALLAAGSGVGKSGNQAGGTGGLVVFDEFTSVVDRTVAKIGSAAVAKAIRRTSPRLPPGSPTPDPLRFVAVTCHYDIVEWLAPDWVLDLQSQTLTRGSPRWRPGIACDLFQTKSQTVWNLFKKHHYLSHSLPKGARFYVGCIEGQPACLVVVGMHFGRINLDRGYTGVRLISRIVTLPDFQGVGIGGAMLDQVGELLATEGLQARITTSHPGMIARLRHSPAWRVTKFSLGNARRSMTSAIARGQRRSQDTSMPSVSSRYICAAKYIKPIN